MLRSADRDWGAPILAEEQSMQGVTGTDQFWAALKEGVRSAEWYSGVPIQAEVQPRGLSSDTPAEEHRKSGRVGEECGMHNRIDNPEWGAQVGIEELPSTAEQRRKGV